MLLLGALAMFHFYSPATAQAPQPDELHKQVQRLSQQVAQLEQQQAMPALVLEPVPEFHRLYLRHLSGWLREPAPAIRARVSGTGFLVGDGLLATNHHVAEPWYGDSGGRKPDSGRRCLRCWRVWWFFFPDRRLP